MIHIWGMLWKISLPDDTPNDIRNKFSNSFFLQLVKHIIQNGGQVGRVGLRRRIRNDSFKPWLWYGFTFSDFSDIMSTNLNRITHASLPGQLLPFASTQPFKATSRIDNPVFVLHDNRSVWVLGNLAQINNIQELVRSLIDVQILLKCVFCKIDGISWEVSEKVKLPSFTVDDDPEIGKVLETLALPQFYQKMKSIGGGMQLGLRNSGVDLILSNPNRMVNASNLNAILIWYAILINPEIRTHGLLKTLPDMIRN